MFWNLVLNAIQSEPKDGVIRMRCASEPASADHPASVVVEIADRGHGIPPELVERIFEPFFTTRPRGSGLGLATVHRLIELHAGSLALESQPGEGTRVRVSLPVDSD